MSEQKLTLSSSASALPVDRARATPSGFGQLIKALQRFIRTSPIGALAALVWILLMLMAIFANSLAPYPPQEADYGAIRQAPSAAHLLGADDLGRDVLSRIIFGARITLLVSISSVLIGDVIGFIWGVASGYLGKRFDLISQRILDILFSFPSLILALLLLVAIGAGLSTVILAIAITRIPSSTRVIRSVALSIKESAYVEAARSVGVPTWQLMLRHVAPQCIAPLTVIATLNLGSAIFAESALSFLGLGIPPPAPSWGNMLGGVLAASFRPSWWLVVFPGLAITIAIMATNLIGDALRDFLDPKLKKRLE
jgi:peptide/nickel transport system permease protein